MKSDRYRRTFCLLPGTRVSQYAAGSRRDPVLFSELDLKLYI